jgi:hypothetical protein
MMVPLSHFATYLSNIYFYIILFYFEDSILIYSQILFYPILYLFSEFFLVFPDIFNFWPWFYLPFLKR